MRSCGTRGHGRSLDIARRITWNTSLPPFAAATWGANGNEVYIGGIRLCSMTIGRTSTADLLLIT
jgi:hypothetical protein